MPPKKRISVARKSHIPRVEASFCCSTSSNWWRSAKEWLANLHLLEDRIIVGFVSHHGSNVEVLRRRRRGGLPFETGSVPGISGSEFAVPHRPDEVDGGDEVADGEHRGSGSGQHVINLELFGIGVIAPWHSEIAHDELREEGEIEAEEHDQRGQLGPALGIHAACDLRPPVVKASEIGHQSTSDHDVVEMRHDEISVGDVHVKSEGGEERAGEAANRKKSDEAEGVEHRRVVGDGSFIERGGPIENFDGGRHGDEKAQERKHQAGVNRLAGHKHVVAQTRNPRTAMATLEKATKR